MSENGKNRMAFSRQQFFLKETSDSILSLSLSERDSSLEELRTTCAAHVSPGLQDRPDSLELNVTQGVSPNKEGRGALRAQGQRAWRAGQHMGR